MIVFLNIKDKKSNFNNTGDNACSPYLYFDFPFESKHECLVGYEPKPGESCIVGGGGVFMPWHIEHCFPKLQNCPIKIVWGAGVNNHGSNSFDAPKFLKNWDMVAMRDRQDVNFFEHVPCPSCMHPALDNPGPPTEEAVIYEHAHYPINGFNYPRMNNVGDSMSEKVTFIRKGNVVITNTYHGLYWAYLLGRQAILYKPFSNRHLFFYRYSPMAYDAEQVKKLVKSTIWDDTEGIALPQARGKTSDYYRRVCKYVEWATS